MAVSLQKGQKVDLTKGNAGLSRVLVGLGWDAADTTGKGLLGSIFKSKPMNIDCDSSVLMLNEQGRLERKENLIYFANLSSACGSVQHTGDNLTGDGDGDDEQIIIDLSKVPSSIHKLVFVVNIYDCINRKQDFGLIQNAFIRVADMRSRQEIVRYNLSENYTGKTSLIVGEIYRYQNEWKFAAIGEGTSDDSLSQIVKRYQ